MVVDIVKDRDNDKGRGKRGREDRDNEKTRRIVRLPNLDVFIGSSHWELAENGLTAKPSLPSHWLVQQLGSAKLQLGSAASGFGAEPWQH